MSVRQLPQAVQELQDQQPPSPRLSLENVYVIGALAVAVAAALCTTVRPHDYWWHITYGRTIVTTGSIPTVDALTYTRGGEPFFNQMWLPQTLMYLLHRTGGVHLVVVAHAIAIGLAYGLVLRVSILLSGRTKLAALVLLAAVLPLSFSNWAVRPQPYAFPLFVAFVSILMTDRLRPDSTRRFSGIWLLPVLMAVWVNVHGSFMLGLVLVSLAAGADLVVQVLRRQSPASGRLLAVAAATWAATLLNPRGFDVLRYVMSLTGNASVATVSEWQPVTPSNVTGLLYFALSAIVILSLVYSRRRPTPSETLIVVALMLLGFTGQRHTTWFAFAAAPVLSMQIGSMLRRRGTSDAGSSIVNGALVAVFALLVVLALPWVREAVAPPPLGAIVQDTPTAATDHLADLADPPRRIFNDLGYGSYLAWAMPQQKTFIDTRFELFPIEQVEDYRQLSQGVDVQRLTDKYDFDGFLVSRKYQPALVSALKAAGEWRTEYEDGEAVIFLPEDA